MKAIHTLCCRGLCNLLPTVYSTSKTQVSLAPTSISMLYELFKHKESTELHLQVKGYVVATDNVKL
jgi:CRISPR/Cas system endoribonuclease Cas6 (RAMP superfamily)